MHLVAHDFLKGLALQDLIGFLLGAQFNQQGLVDPLKCCHFGVLCWIGRMGSRFELADVSFTLCCICVDCPHGLEIADIYRIRYIDRGPLGRNRLLPLCIERGIAGDLADAGKA